MFSCVILLYINHAHTMVLIEGYGLFLQIHKLIKHLLLYIQIFVLFLCRWFVMTSRKLIGIKIRNILIISLQ